MAGGLKSLPGSRSPSGSLSSALFWCLLILLVASAILSALYREATERAFDQRLLVYANELAADLATPGDPERRELGSLGNPQFDIPLSGWYWQIGRPDALPRDIRARRNPCSEAESRA